MLFFASISAHTQFTYTRSLCAVPQKSVDAEALYCLARAKEYLDVGLADDAVPELQAILALSSPEREYRPQPQLQTQARSRLAEALFKLRHKGVEVISIFNELLKHVGDKDEALLYHACRTAAALSAFYSLCRELQAEGTPAEGTSQEPFGSLSQKFEVLMEAFGSEAEASAEADELRRRANRLIEETTKLEQPVNTPSGQSKAAQMQNMAAQMRNVADGISMCHGQYDKIGVQGRGSESDLLAGTALGAENTRTTMLAQGLAITMKARSSPGWLSWLILP